MPLAGPVGLDGQGVGVREGEPRRWGGRRRREDETHAAVGEALEPREGEYTFGWLDDVVERLTDGGVGLILATPTASPPPWISLAHPDALP
ncbi:MAG: beta-galactosidase, partial [Cellulomonadaceae bacterium]|nr:beta-galactosidase [Cellulomonadaceae bacterium]